jgi:sirohydrochlorin ferrochelatase
MDSESGFGNGQRAVILFAHGSAVEEANQGVRELAERVQSIGSYPYVRAAFLGPGQPELGSVVAEAVAAGARRIVVVPYFLTIGIHLRRDLPKLVAAEKERYPEVEFRVSKSLEDHPDMAGMVLSRILEITKETQVSP